MCYYAKLGHSTSKGVDISTGILKIWVHWGPAQLSLATGVCLTTYIHTPLHTRATMTNLIAVGHIVQVNVRRSAEKNWFPHIPPYKVTQGHHN